MKVKEIFVHAVTLILLTILSYFLLNFMQYTELNPTLRYIELFVQGWKYWVPVMITGVVAVIWFKINYTTYYK